MAVMPLSHSWLSTPMGYAIYKNRLIDPNLDGRIGWLVKRRMLILAGFFL